MANVYFELTKEFNARGTIALLAAGQAVVYYRIAMMSKDGDWVLRETREACARVLEVLGARGARYRFGSPLDVRWLRGGWSSHLEFRDEEGRRVRCDFLTRPPRVGAAALDRLFAAGGDAGPLRVVDLDSLIRMKQTQRAKDYPVIAELARLLLEDGELRYTTDPDRIIALAARPGASCDRPAARIARAGGTREDVAVAVARETLALQEEDRRRVEAYEAASAAFLAEFRRRGIAQMPLGEAHGALVDLAGSVLPADPLGMTGEGTRRDADAR
ncbi:MAG TPA: hypothetical protein DCM87_06630 [Planctomycetes bacterium]|nr:hypothetical protein [Planctomycetota bacterium]